MKEKLRVLYAEDNACDADLTRVHLELKAPHIELEVVDTGRKCLTRLDEASYDVLLLDNRLPDIDGITILQELAKKSGAAPPTVLATAAGDEALVVQALRLGACDYIPKQGNYLENLPAILESAAADRKRLEAERNAAVIRRRVLYVEHDRADIDLTLRHFAETAPHFSVEAIRSSDTALTLVRQNGFDLVLSDLRMPDMSALDLLRELKRGGPAVPVIVITGQGDEAAALAALKLGAYDYIVKRDNYLTQLPYAIENAIARAQLAEKNRRLQAELARREEAEAEKARLFSDVQRQRERLADIIASVPGVVWESWGPPDDPNHKMAFVSSYVETMLGYSVQEWLSEPGFWHGAVHAEDRERAIREASDLFSSGRNGASQFRMIAKDGRTVWVEVRFTIIPDENGNPAGLRGVAVDITAAKEAERARAYLEEQLRHAQKMDSIGRLAGGIAHDFNNLLTTINGYAELMLQELSPEDPLRDSLEEIRKAGNLAAELTHQLLAFSRGQIIQPRDLALNSLIQEDTNLLRRVLGEDIELTTVLDPELGYVKGDEGQMHQVILNIAANARDAMPHGGRLALETQNFTVYEDFAQTHPPLEPGDYVLLSISDTGIGMDAETRSRIFEPFFTTKAKGKGTGLGLSIVYGIVRQSGGSIFVDSQPGAGTTFRVFLPRVAKPACRTAETRTEPETSRGSETLLVVEDDDTVRRLTCHVLREHGYSLIEAANGREALLASERHTGPIPLMITDIVMPYMSGWELADRLRSQRPEMRVLYMSGYTDDAIHRRGPLGPGMFFLQKPFVGRELAQTVRQILDQRE
ncbi:MAG TPA: response regulator [Bryobacteraceae bacterium]|nr:response regulator [Bryobacteraceae bacterium]HPU71421.1 response regulator [Bryobacteraceae bacterium]